MYDPIKDHSFLNSLPEGVLIRPSADSADSDWFCVALKVTATLWTVTGHAHVVQSRDLVRFAKSWQVIYPSQVITV